MTEILEVKKIERAEKCNHVLSLKNKAKKPSFHKILKIFNLEKLIKSNNGGLVDNGKYVEENLSVNSDAINKAKNLNSVTKFFKIKQVKSVFIVLIISVLALLILSNPLSFNDSDKTNSFGSLGYVTGLEYCEQLENKLAEVLGNISGVGEISVMVTVEGGPEIKIATSTDERVNTTNNASGVVTNNTIVSDPVIITSSGQNNPLVLSEISPQITGVIVVAQGAKDVKVRLNLLQAVEALLNVPTENIQIYY